MPHLNAILTDDQVSAIKAALWNGAKLTELAKRYGVSDRSISSIRCGHHWPEIVWPDGATGPMNRERRVEITRARRQPGNKQAQKQLKEGAKINASRNPSRKRRQKARSH